MSTPGWNLSSVTTQSGFFCHRVCNRSAAVDLAQLLHSRAAAFQEEPLLNMILFYFVLMYESAYTREDELDSHMYVGVVPPLGLKANSARQNPGCSFHGPSLPVLNVSSQFLEPSQ